MAKLRAPEDVWCRVRLAPGTEARTRPHAIVLPRERQPCTICLVYTSWVMVGHMQDGQSRPHRLRGPECGQTDTPRLNG